MREFKIGDIVITTKNGKTRRGIIYSMSNVNGKIHYTIKNINDHNSWGHNIFPTRDEIKLDIEAIRNEKLNQLGI